jgi:hypothetical protein
MMKVLLCLLKLNDECVPACEVRLPYQDIRIIA